MPIEDAAEDDDLANADAMAMVLSPRKVPYRGVSANNLPLSPADSRR